MALELDPDTSKRAIGARLIAVRKARGYTPGALATALGLSPQRWFNYENGNTNIPPDVLARVWQVTGATSDFVLFGRMDNLPTELAAVLRAAESKARRA